MTDGPCYTGLTPSVHKAQSFRDVVASATTFLNGAMKLSLITIIVFATSAAAAAMPRNSAERDDHSLQARAIYSVNVAELETRMRQLEHERNTLLGFGETDAASRKGYEIEQLKTQLEGYQSYHGKEDDVADLWNGALGSRAAVVVNIPEMQARIHKLEQERAILLNLGETEAATRKAAEIEPLQVQLALFQSTEESNADILAGISKRHKRHAKHKRQSTATTFQEVQDEIAELTEEIVALRAAGQREEAAALHRELDQLRAMGDSYADAERTNFRD